MTWLTDPRAFNWLIIGMFAVAGIRWAFAGDWKQVAYFMGAVILNVAVTGMAGK